MPDLHASVQWIDELIREEIPGFQYAIKWQKAYYGLYGLRHRGWRIIERVAYEVSVKIVFPSGADFALRAPLGNTDRSRCVKVKTLLEAQRPKLLDWIKQAGQVEVEN